MFITDDVTLTCQESSDDETEQQRVMFLELWLTTRCFYNTYIETKKYPLLMRSVTSLPHASPTRRQRSGPSVEETWGLLDLYLDLYSTCLDFLWAELSWVDSFFSLEIFNEWPKKKKNIFFSWQILTKLVSGFHVGSCYDLVDSWMVRLYFTSSLSVML